MCDEIKSNRLCTEYIKKAVAATIRDVVRLSVKQCFDHWNDQ